jgi:hypothetical protein
VVRVVHKSDFVMQWLMFLIGSVCFSSIVVAKVKGLNTPCAGQLHYRQLKFRNMEFINQWSDSHND